MKIEIGYKLNQFRWFLYEISRKIQSWAARNSQLCYPSEHIGTELAKNLISIAIGVNSVVDILIKQKGIR